MLTTEKKETYIVIEKVVESPTVSTLRLALFDGGVPPYVPGQFITVYFPESGTPEGKAYSISSAPHEDVLSISVKAIGEFSRRLCALCAGDRVTASLPYGYFYSESKESPLVMIAGGIGVAPFRSMIKDSIERYGSRDLTLFYSSGTQAELVFKEELNRLQQASSGFKIFYFVTRETVSGPVYLLGRIDPDRILERITAIAPGREFLICGSIAFVGGIWKGLRARGVPEEALYTEAFFSH